MEESLNRLEACLEASFSLRRDVQKNKTDIDALVDDIISHGNDAESQKAIALLREAYNSYSNN